MMPENLPYRPCAGVILLNKKGLVFMAKRLPEQGLTSAQTLWQMPQGGIDEGEDPENAALRELYEETNVQSVKVLRTSEKWFVYDLPAELIGVAWKGKYRGQKMKWTLARFIGTDDEINVESPASGHKPEFGKWKWMQAQKSLAKVVPFKRQLYKDVFDYFAQDLETLDQ